MEQYSIQKIGVFRADESGFRIELDPKYKPALDGLEGFSHLQIVWWFSHCDNAECRGVLRQAAPYIQGPDALGTFATRSPQRPNPIALSCAQMVHMDRENATIWIAYTDAEDGTPVLDIKPYTPSLDRVEAPVVPEWCGSWPRSLEESARFDWDMVFRQV